MQSNDRHGSSDPVLPTALVRTAGLTKRFPGVLALNDVDFELNPGEVHCLIGENGAGKSTFIKILAGAEQPDEGAVYVGGRRVSFSTPHEAQRSGMAFIYQELTVVPQLSVMDNILLGHELASQIGILDRSGARRRADELLSAIGFSGFDPDRKVARLSVAEQQAVMMARALHLDARVVAFDEPTASLDGDEVDKLFHVIDGLRAEGRGILYITHRLDELARIGDRVSVFKDGSRVATLPVGEANHDELVRMMVGRDIGVNFPPKNRSVGEIKLTARNLQNDVIQDVNLDLRQGEIVGIAGLVGSGRTELLRALFGADPISSGQVLVDGKGRDVQAPWHAIGQGIGLVPEDRRGQGIVGLRSVAENIALAWSQRKNRNGQNARTLVQRTIDQLQIRTSSVDKRVSLLSGGNQQKVVVGKWLAIAPKVLLLDEPTRGIDVGAKAELFAQIDQLARDGVAIAMVSSELPEVLGMADRVLVMRGGRVVGELPGSCTEEDVLALAMTESLAR